MDVVEENTDVGLKTLGHVCPSNVFQLPLAGLMNKPKPVLPIVEILERIDNCTIDGLRALASAEDQNGVRRHVHLGWDGLELRANGIPGHDCPLTEIRLRPCVRDGCKIDPLPKYTIGKPRNRVLLHHNSRIAAEYCSAQHRK